MRIEEVLLRMRIREVLLSAESVFLEGMSGRVVPGVGNGYFLIFVTSSICSRCLTQNHFTC